MTTKGQGLIEVRVDSVIRGTAAAGPLVIAALLAVLASVAPAAEPYKPFKAEGGPLDIRLVAIRPDGGEKFYDPNGQELRWAGGVLDITDDPWDGQYRRDFVFKLPDVKDPILFDIWHGVHLCGTRLYLKRAGIRPMGVHAGGQFYKWSTTFPAKYQDGTIAGLIPRSVGVRQVDLALRYFYGPPQDPICSFTGPLEVGRTIAADENLPYQMTCEQVTRPSGTETFRLTFSIDVLRDDSVSVLLYGTDGKRRHPAIISRGERPSVRFHGLPGGIAKVTLGERAYERVFRNVVIECPPPAVSGHAAYLDRVAEVLDLQRLPVDRMAFYNIRTPSQAIAVIDLIQGGDLSRRILEVLANDERPVDLSRADEPTRQKLRSAAQRWAASWDLYMRLRGVQLGLLGDWPEFFNQAVRLLQDDYHYLPYGDGVDHDLDQIAQLLLNRWQDHLTPEQRDNLAAYRDGRRPLPVLSSLGAGAGGGVRVERAVSSGRAGPGPLGPYALSFDGVDDCLIVPASPSLAVKPSFFIEVWARPDPCALAESVFVAAPEDRPWPEMSLMRLAGPPPEAVRTPVQGSADDEGWPVEQVRPFHGLNGRQSGGFMGFLSRGLGNVFVVSRNGRATQSLRSTQGHPLSDQSGWEYIDWYEQPSDRFASTEGPLVIGASNVPNGVAFKGQIAEVRLWNKILMDEEPFQYGARSLTGNEPNLVACWTFDEGSGQIVHDIGPNHNDAYLGNSRDADAADPRWIELTGSSQAKPAETLQETSGVVEESQPKL